MTNTTIDPTKSSSNQANESKNIHSSENQIMKSAGDNMNTSINQSTTENTMNTSSDQATIKAESSMNISEQFTKLKDLFLLQDTGKTFIKSLRLLFIVIKESMILMWLALCWCVVGISLMGSKTTQASEKIVSWWHSLSNQNKSTKEVAATTLRQAAQSIISKARKQVGLQID